MIFLEVIQPDNLSISATRNLKLDKCPVVSDEQFERKRL